MATWIITFDFISNVEIHKLDHKYPGSAEGRPIVVLYGEIGTKRFNDFHLKLKKLAEDGDVTYVLRHFLKNRAGPKVRLSGEHHSCLILDKIWKLNVQYFIQLRLWS